MDLHGCPNVNWKFCNSMVEVRNENDQYLGLIDVGTCSLNMGHGAFRASVQMIRGGIDAVLKVVYNLLDNSSKKRALQKNHRVWFFPTAILWSQEHER